MWYRATTRMPYYGDPDYRNAVVASIKQALGDVPVDVTRLDTWGLVEFDVELSESEIPSLPLLGAVRSAIDREMVVGARTVV